MDDYTQLKKQLRAFTSSRRPQVDDGSNQGSNAGSDSLPVTVSFGGYLVDVEANQYTRVVLTFADGATETFSGQYTGRTTFAHRSFRGEERTAQTNPADEVYEQFHGPITEVTIESADGSTTVSNSSLGAPTGVQFNCSNVILEGEEIFLSSFWLEFTDGSRKEYGEADFGRTVTIGSAGRVVETAYLAPVGDGATDAGWFAFSNPNSNCNPSPAETNFECTQVRLTTAMNIGGDNMSTGSISLFFADGTEQEFSDVEGDLPRTFAGDGDNSGKVIEAVGVDRMPWGAYHYLVNPTLDSCLNSQPDFSATFDCYSVVVSGDSYDRVELQTINGSETFEGDFGGDTRFGFFGANRLRDQDAPNRTYRAFSGPIASVEVFDGDTSELFESDTISTCWIPTFQVGCSSISFDQPPDGDFRARFPHAYKRWDGPREGIQDFGSPGRTLLSFDAGGRGLLLFNEPDRSCDPASGPASTFDCTTFTIDPAEFIDSEPVFNYVQLTFTDDTTQRIGLDSGPDEYTAPETFAGSDEHEGKVIQEATVYVNNADTFFEFTNPDADSCSGDSESGAPLEDRDSESPTGDSTSRSRDLSNAEVVGRVRLDGEEYLVLRQVPDASPELYAFVDANYELLEPGRATDVAISFTWMNSYNADSSERLAYTNRQYERFQNVETMGEVANVLAQISGAVALAAISPSSSVMASATALVDVVEWQINEISNPYQEQYTRMAACSGTVAWADENLSEPGGSFVEVADEVTEISQVMLDTAGTVGAIDDIASAASNVRDILRRADSIRDTVDGIESVEELKKASYTALVSMAVDAAVSAATNIAEAQAKSGALGAGNAAARRPLLQEIISLEQRIEDGSLGPTGILRLQALRQTDYQLEAAALRAMSAYQSNLSSGPLGVGYDVVFNTGQLASEFSKTANTWLNLSHYMVAQTGIFFDRALQRYENSLNYQEFGDQEILTRP